jgi:hypothetical protein
VRRVPDVVGVVVAYKGGTMKPKIKGRNWWGRGMKTEWSSGSKLHSSMKKIENAKEQVREFLKGEEFVETQKSSKSKQS